MGQKSLSSLHRIDSSMIWSSYIHDKRLKWLSYNLWFAYVQFYLQFVWLSYVLPSALADGWNKIGVIGFSHIILG